MNSTWRRTNDWAITCATTRDNRIIQAAPREEVGFQAFFIWVVNQMKSVAGGGCDVSTLIQQKGERRGPQSVVCGKRDGSSFERLDGLKCHFKMTVLEKGSGKNKQIEVLSYVLHVDGQSEACPSFLRWEFATERKHNVDAVKEPLSHLHPGHDHIRLPSPVLSPKELIGVFLGLENWD